MSALENFVIRIQSSSANKNDLRELKQTLSASHDNLRNNLNDSDFLSILFQLNPEDHALAWTWLLWIQAGKSGFDKKVFSQFSKHVVMLITRGNIFQIRMVIDKFINVCQKYAELSASRGRGMSVIRPLRQAINKIRLEDNQTTPLHASGLMACIRSKNYKAASLFLDTDIFNISKKSYKTTSKDILCFCYYAGIIKIGLKDYKSALDYFTFAFTMPSMSLSQITIESYKKAVLISLLVNGKKPSIPKFASSAVLRRLSGLCSKYKSFAETYANSSTTDPLHKFATENHDEFSKDKNFGLVKQCIQAHYRLNIKRHTRTFITLSLDFIGSSVKINSAKEVEKSILRMIENGEVFAKINQKDGMLSFLENPEQYDTNQMISQMEGRIEKSINLCNQLKKLDEQITATPDYLQQTLDIDLPDKLLQQQLSSGGSAGASASQIGDTDH